MGEKSAKSVHGNMIREQNKNVAKKYEILQVLGAGSMGTVSMVKVKEKKIGGSAFKSNKSGLAKVMDNLRDKLLKTNESNISNSSERRKEESVYALKSIQLDRVKPIFVEELKNEIEILKSMDHPNIVKAHEVYYFNKQIYLVLEICSGGDLYSMAPYSPRRACHIVSELCSAVRYMHDHAIVHRDLKFENLMFANKDPEAPIKVLDFGLSKKFKSGKHAHMNEGVGTIYTMAPQVLQGIYTSQVDLWSVGVISFMLLSSEKPFVHRKRRVMIDKIMRAEYNMDGPIWATISGEAKDFVSKLLVVDPKKRLNARGALLHPWLQHEKQQSDLAPSEEVVSHLPHSFASYQKASELKKLALNVIAHKSSTSEIAALRKAFDKYDTARDGIISQEEFREALKGSAISDDIVEEIFQSIDINKNGHIMYTEFLAATLEAHGYIEEERIADAFDRIDSDDTGFISRENLRDFLADYSPKEIDEIIKAADTNADGKISYDEFLQAFRSQTFAQVTKAAKLDQSMAEPSAAADGSESGQELLGLDAPIPGGKYDPEMIDQQTKC